MSYDQIYFSIEKKPEKANGKSSYSPSVPDGLGRKARSTFKLIEPSKRQLRKIEPFFVIAIRKHAIKMSKSSI